MAGPGIEWTFSSDDKNVARTLLNIQKQNEKLTQRLSENVAKSREAAAAARKDAEAKREAAAAERKVTQVIERGMSARDRYKRDLAQIKKAHRDGVIDINRLREARRSLSQEFRKPIIEKTKGVKDAAVAVGKMAASYLTISQLSGGLVSFYQEQATLQGKAAENAERIATAQSTTIKNFAGLQPETSKELLDFARTVPFKSLALVTEALGSAQSTAADPQLIKEAVARAAEISINEPTKLEGFTVGTLSVAKRIGTDDIEKSLGFLLRAGSLAQITEPLKLAKNLPPAIGGAISQLPAGADEAARIETARQAAALFAAITKAATDTTGELTSTATVKFNTELAKFFRSLPEERAAREKEIQALEEKARVTTKEKLDIDGAILDAKRAELEQRDVERRFAQVKKMTPEQQLELAQARQETAERKERINIVKERAGLNQDEKDKLSSLRREVQGIANLAGQDATTIEQRTALIRRENAVGESILRELFEEKEFGEAKVQGAFRQLVRGGDALNLFLENLAPGGLEFTRREFDRQKAQQRLTPELRAGQFRQRAAGVTERITTDELDTVRDTTAKLVQTALKEAAGSDNFIRGTLRFLTDRPLAGFRVRGGRTPEEVIGEGIRLLERERSRREDPSFFVGPPSIRGPAQQDEAIKELTVVIDLLRTELQTRAAEGNAAAENLNAAAQNMNRGNIAPANQQANQGQQPVLMGN